MYVIGIPLWQPLFVAARGPIHHCGIHVTWTECGWRSRNTMYAGGAVYIFPFLCCGISSCRGSVVTAPSPTGTAKTPCSRCGACKTVVVELTAIHPRAQYFVVLLGHAVQQGRRDTGPALKVLPVTVEAIGTFQPASAIMYTGNGITGHYSAYRRRSDGASAGAWYRPQDSPQDSSRLCERSVLASSQSENVVAVRTASMKSASRMVASHQHGQQVVYKRVGDTDAVVNVAPTWELPPAIYTQATCIGEGGADLKCALKAMHNTEVNIAETPGPPKRKTPSGADSPRHAGTKRARTSR